MARIFFAKIRIYNYDYSAGASQLSVQTFGNDENDARENVNRMVGNWDGVLHYDVAKISNKAIPLQKYVVFCTLKYYNRKTREIKFNCKAESPKDAESFFREVISSWRDIVSIEIDGIEERI
ncbi:MAG: hypothetical protein K0B11_16485 [Mariniphaga sp.]|nr:hypothetical protein [Mariniphaga sp.]